MNTWSALFLFLLLPSAMLLNAQAGSLDANFDIGTSFNNWRIIKLAVDAENRVYAVGGGATDQNATFMVRYLPDGTPDPTFNAVFNNTVQTIAIQEDGSILVGGFFTTCNLTPRNRIVRLLPDGELDDSFVIGAGFNGAVWTVSLQNDGKIVVGGSFTQYNNANALRLVRLNENGTLDAAFLNTDFPSWTVEDTAIQPDGKVIAVGQFNGLGAANVPAGHVARFNADGSADQSFTASPGASGPIHCVALQPDGKILLGGTYPTYNGQTHRRIIRLNTDGSVDATFSTGEGFMQPPVNAIVVQADGKIIAGGEFFTYNGASSTRIIRLNADGSFDPTFSVGSGFDMTVYDLKLYADGEQVLVGGQFSTYNGVARQRLALLNLTGTCEEAFTTDEVTSCGPFIWVNGVTYTESNNEATFTTVSSAGCDSTITLNLIVTSLNTAVELVDGTLFAQEEGATFQWYDCFDNEAVGGANEASFTPLTTGDYAVEVTLNGCSLISECQTVVVTNVDYLEGSQTGKLNMYPNPASNQITLLTDEPIQALVIYDVRGAFVKQFRQRYAPAQIDVSGFSPGSYLVEVRLLSGSVLRGRLVVSQ